jgi:diacylglycerol kinase family enzyme
VSQRERHLVIVNPAAGGSACGRRAPAAVQRLRQAGLAVEVVGTRAAGDAIVLARDAVAAGQRSLIAAGGDGTLYEVVNGVLAAGTLASRPCVGACRSAAQLVPARLR